MPFGMWGEGGSADIVTYSNQVLDGGPDPPKQGQILGWERGHPIVKYMEHEPSAGKRWLVRSRWHLASGHVNHHKEDHLTKTNSSLALGQNAAFCQIILTSCLL